MLQIVFIIITLLFLLFFYMGTGRNKSVLWVAIPWIAFISVLSLFHFFQNTNTTPPRFLIVLLGNLLFILYLYKKLNSTQLNNRYVLLIHTLRIPVEIILYCLFLQKQVPKVMTYYGWNFDVCIGISALILFVLIHFFKIHLSKKKILIGNLIGLLFLLNIVVIAILSAPLPIQQFAFHQPNIAVLQFPFVSLPSFIVPIVFVTHIIKIKQLVSA